MLGVAVATVDAEVGACSACGVKVGKYSRVYANIKSVIKKSMGFMIDWDEQKASVAEPHVRQSRNSAKPRTHNLAHADERMRVAASSWGSRTRTKVAGSCGLIDRRAYSNLEPISLAWTATVFPSMR